MLATVAEKQRDDVEIFYIHLKVKKLLSCRITH